MPGIRSPYGSSRHASWPHEKACPWRLKNSCVKPKSVFRPLSWAEQQDGVRPCPEQEGAASGEVQRRPGCVI
jgi:hypothetical protein